MFLHLSVSHSVHSVCVCVCVPVCNGQGVHPLDYPSQADTLLGRLIPEDSHP